MTSNSLEGKLDKNETVGNEAFKWSVRGQVQNSMENG